MHPKDIAAQLDALFSEAAQSNIEVHHTLPDEWTSLRDILFRRSDPTLPGIDKLEALLKDAFYGGATSTVTLLSSGRQTESQILKSIIDHMITHVEEI